MSEEMANNIYDQARENTEQNLYPTIGITEITQKSDHDGNLTISEYKQMLERISIPYPNKDEIPILKINYKGCFFNEEIIDKSQLPIEPFGDEKFNKCKRCKINFNVYFCEKCRMNICEKCSNNCNKEKDLIDLNNLKNISKYYKKQIQNCLDKIEKDPKKISLTIYIIKAIIEKDYNNYFHYKNIQVCQAYSHIYEEKYNNAFLQIKYTINNEINIKENDYKIFGKAFVENNKDKISLRINDIESPLVETIKIDDNDKFIEVILINNSLNLRDLSYMFCNCKSKLIEVIEIEESKIFLNNVKNISNMFNNCLYLEKIDLDFFKIFENLEIIDSLFSGCEKLNKIENINRLNTKSVKKMDKLFKHCHELKNLDEIEGFITDNVESFDEMFKDCSSLQKLPESISSKWEMGKAKSFKKMFKGCSSLKEIPYIKDWKNLKVQNIEKMFEGCSALKKLPNISDWDVGNAKSLEGIFKGCSALTELPKDIIYWDVKNVISMKDMFNGCKTIRIANLPNLKNWSLTNLKTMKRIFFGCLNLKNKNVKIENIFIFNNSEIINLKNIFE